MLDWSNVIENFIAGALVVITFSFFVPILYRKSKFKKQLESILKQISKMEGRNEGNEM